MSLRAGFGGALILALAASGAAAQNTAEEPFAVLSRGRPLPHVERTVVVLPDTTPATPPADSVRPPTRTASGTTAAAPTTGAASSPAGRGTGTGTGAGTRTTTGGGTITPVSTPPPTSGRSTTTAPPAAPPPTSGRSTSAAPPSAPASRASAAPRTHTVEWGDTWYGIAVEYNVSSSSLRAANPDVEPERLRAGIVLRIPSGPGTARTPANTTPTTRTTSAPERRTHKVEPGESLWGIARRYGVSTASIREANEMEDDRVRIGETLVIPEED